MTVEAKGLKVQQNTFLPDSVVYIVMGYDKSTPKFLSKVTKVTVTDIKMSLT